MGYLTDAEGAQLLEQAKKSPEVETVIQKYETAWSSKGLPVNSINYEFIGPVFVGLDEEEPLLPEDRRRDAQDPLQWQLVFMTPVGMNLKSFRDENEARTTLANLQRDEYGEGGGLLFKGEAVVAENLFLKVMLKEDYVDFFHRAVAEPAKRSSEKQDATNLAAVVETTTERLRRLTKLADDIARLRDEYAAKGLSRPEVIRGRPSEALIEFARLFPQYVHLGGCTGD